jgi:glyoxylase-like metal-dependent hydrolase (beta-lactamase superfamily II)
MSQTPSFNQEFIARYGEAEELSPLIRRVLARNPGPFTFKGTGTFIVGRGTVAVIDPGPDDAAHMAKLRQALSGQRVSHILVTHTHRDHSPAARILSESTGAPVLAFGPHPRFAHHDGPKLDHGGDTGFSPDRRLADGEIISGSGWTLEAVHTPGHLANHLCFALREEKALFSGDHVMAWSTSVIAPPEGHMGDYLASLEKCLERDETIYWPTHGGPVTQPRRFVRAVLGHRKMRERAVLDRLAAGDTTAPDMVAHIYKGLDPRLEGAAAFSLLAHLEHLVEKGKVVKSDSGDHQQSFFLR